MILTSDQPLHQFRISLNFIYNLPQTFHKLDHLFIDHPLVRQLFLLFLGHYCVFLAQLEVYQKTEAYF